MNNQAVIQVSGLGKRYRLGTGRSRHDSLREFLADAASAVFRRKADPANEPQTFWALKDASFEIRRGENVGIIGLNGAGKSTLLKILSRITGPTAGTARVEGRVGALLEVGTGFHPDLTGRENIFLYGAILGMGKEEIADKFEEIVDFSDIRPFIDTPVKRYSSGMYVRLAFSVAAHLEPDILLLDEVLSVGDLPFQRKCMEFAKSLQEKDSTILFVSHNMFSIKTMCERVIYLRKGQVIFDGPTEEGIALFEEDCRLSTLSWTEDHPDEWPIKISDVKLYGSPGETKTVFDHGERMTIELEYDAVRPIANPNFIVAFVRSDGVPCCNFSTETDGIGFDEISGRGIIRMQTPPLHLVAEMYAVHIVVREPGFQKVLCAQIGSTFHIRHQLFDVHFGVFHEAADWEWRAQGMAEETRTDTRRLRVIQGASE